MTHKLTAFILAQYKKNKELNKVKKKTRRKIENFWNSST